MKRSFILVILIFCSNEGFSLEEPDSFFSNLDSIIVRKEFYEQKKDRQIEEYWRALDRLNPENLRQKFDTYQKLHDAYYTLNYDSAFSCVSKMSLIARTLNDSSLIIISRMELGRTLLAAGLFDAARDTLLTVKANVLKDTVLSEFYYMSARLYFDMADYYQKTFYVEKYQQSGMQYLDSAVASTSFGSRRFYSLMGLKYVRLGEFEQAVINYRYLFDHFSLKGRQYAIDASTFGFALDQVGKKEKSVEWLIKAAMEDIRLSNKENVALINLSNTLFRQGKIDQASKYLNVALQDAVGYGAMQRRFQISKIRPIIEAAKLRIIQRQKMHLKYYAYTVSSLSLLIILILVVLFKQLQKIKLARDEIRKSILELQQKNNQLREVNLIKEEYIGHFFKTNSDLIDKLDFYRQHIENKVLSGKYKELISLVDRSKIKDEREEMYRTFDTVFLNIFPDFIEKYNQLFTEKDSVELTQGSGMTTDLRIFALIRLGITNTEKIAHILNYSVHTINTYKTRIKNKSIVANEDFEREIIKIQSI